MELVLSFPTFMWVPEAEFGLSAYETSVSMR